MSSKQQNSDNVQQQKALMSVVEGLSAQMKAMQMQMVQMNQVNQASYMSPQFIWKQLQQQQQQQFQQQWQQQPQAAYYSPAQLAQAAQAMQAMQMAALARSSVEHIFVPDQVPVELGEECADTEVASTDAVADTDEVVKTVDDEGTKPVVDSHTASSWPKPPSANQTPTVNEQEFPKVTPIAKGPVKPPTKSTSWADKSEKAFTKESPAPIAKPAPKPTSAPAQAKPAQPTSTTTSTTTTTTEPVDICTHRPLTKSLILAGLMFKLDEDEPQYIKFQNVTCKFKCRECQDKPGNGIVHLNVTFIGRCFQTDRVHLEYKKSTKATARDQLLDFTSTFIPDDCKAHAKELMHIDSENQESNEDHKAPRFQTPTFGTFFGKHPSNTNANAKQRSDQGRPAGPTSAAVAKKPAQTKPVFQEDNFPEEEM